MTDITIEREMPLSVVEAINKGCPVMKFNDGWLIYNHGGTLREVVKQNSSTMRDKIEKFMYSFAGRARLLATNIIDAGEDYFSMAPVRGLTLDSIVSDIDNRVPVVLHDHGFNLALMIGNIRKTAWILESGYIGKFKETHQEEAPEISEMGAKMAKNMAAISRLLGMDYSAGRIAEIADAYTSGFQPDSWAIDAMLHHAALSYRSVMQDLESRNLPHIAMKKSAKNQTLLFLKFLHENRASSAEIYASVIDAVRRFDFDRLFVRVPSYENITYSFFEHGLNAGEMRKAVSALTLSKAFERKADRSQEQELEFNKRLMEYITSDDDTRRLGMRQSIMEEFGLTISESQFAENMKYAIYRGIREVGIAAENYLLEKGFSSHPYIFRQFQASARPYLDGMKTVSAELDRLLQDDDPSYNEIRVFISETLNKTGIFEEAAAKNWDSTRNYIQTYRRLRSCFAARDFINILDEFMSMSHLKKFNEENPGFANQSMYHTLVQVGFSDIETLYQAWSKDKKISFREYARGLIISDKRLEPAKSALQSKGIRVDEDCVIGHYVDENYDASPKFKAEGQEYGFGFGSWTSSENYAAIRAELMKGSEAPPIAKAYQPSRLLSLLQNA